MKFNADSKSEKENLVSQLLSFHIISISKQKLRYTNNN